ncbi:hypothetical protein EYF80_008223 [Liparis tanakae]|uniref:Uncharacterized protein n=1 Tax=Liparis tanakae TaxID=230148 RepID=A0A4Z2IUG4_9TELE|nr:hypothetical protein EYF80_008223 [Liparis tanakae]
MALKKSRQGLRKRSGKPVRYCTAPSGRALLLPVETLDQLQRVLQQTQRTKGPGLCYKLRAGDTRNNK